MTTIDVNTLKSLVPLCHLTSDELEILASRTEYQVADKTGKLIELGSKDNRALYLIKGKVQLTAADGRGYVIESDSEKAKHAISHLIPHKYTVVAITPVKYIWIDNQVLDNLVEMHDGAGQSVEDLFVTEDILNNFLFQEIYRDLIDDKLVIPSVPDIIVRIRRVIKEDQDLNRLKSIVQTDPALAALLIKVANSAIFRSDRAVVSIKEAIQRIGTNTLQNFVIGFAMRKLFKSKVPYIKKQMVNLWKHSTEVGAIAYVLATKLKKFNPDHAMLHGLLHDIGMIPILSYADKLPETTFNQGELKETITRLHGDIGGIIMAKWNFPDEFITVAVEADHWYRDSSPEADYCDLVLIAQLFSFMGKIIEKDTPPLDDRVLPPITELPAYHKLGLDDLTPEGGVEILHNAKEEIAQALHLLAM